MIRLAIFVATAGYAGYFPIAPGTIGSIVGLAVYGLVRWVDSPLAEISAIVATAILGVWAGTVAERYFGGIDPGPVVIDEILGMLVTLAFIPVGWAGATAGFFIFRVLDIIKPFPAGRFESLPGGWGVMADDAMAAVYGNIALRALIWVAPSWLT
jgi:phosphatidylglycerophosphatase A